MDLECQSCGAKLVVAPELRTAECPYCASPSVVERPHTPDRPTPTFVLGFSLAREQAGERAREWLRTRHPWAPSRLKHATLQELRGLYVPAWLYSALAHCEYSASIGENYTEQETYTTLENGKMVTKKRTVVRTEWRPLQGHLAEYVPDVLVTASRGLPNEELEHVEPFDLRLLARYEPALLAGWIAEEPSLTYAQCLELARREAVAHLERRLKHFMPGDSHQELKYQPRLEQESLDAVLVPVWVLAARYDPKAPPLRVLVNGQTGEVYGRVPVSWVKVLLTVLAVLAAGALGYLLFVLWGGRS